GSPAGSQNSSPLPAPDIPACTRRSRSTREISSRSPPHRAQNPTPTPGSLPSPPLAPRPCASTVFSSSAGSSAPLRGTPDTPACGSRACPFLPASTAAAGIPIVASLAPLPPTSSVALRRSCGSHTAGSTPPLPSTRKSAAGSLENASTASALPPYALRAPPVFFNHRFQHVLVQTQIRHQLLQPPVLILQLPQPLALPPAHPPILRLPRVHGVLAHSSLSPRL